MWKWVPWDAALCVDAVRDMIDFGMLDSGNIARVDTEPFYSPTYVYKIFDEYDRLLYVGITVDTRSRVNLHRSTSPWFRREAVYFTRYRHPMRYMARYDEIVAIRTLRPKYNKADI